jgi:hypothetical protein
MQHDQALRRNCEGHFSILMVRSGQYVRQFATLSTTVVFASSLKLMQRAYSSHALYLSTIVNVPWFTW